MFIKDFFYRCYSSNLKSWKEQGPAASQALAEICFLAIINCYVLAAWSDFLFGTRISTRILNLGDSSELITVLVALGVIWAIFIFSGYYKKIVKEVEAKELRGKYVVSELARRIYEGVSLALLFIALMLPKA